MFNWSNSKQNFYFWNLMFKWKDCKVGSPDNSASVICMDQSGP